MILIINWFLFLLFFFHKKISIIMSSSEIYFIDLDQMDIIILNVFNALDKYLDFYT